MDAHNICSSAIVGEVLKGHVNYANWRACIMNYLMIRDLWNVVEQTSEPPNHEEIGDEADLKRNLSALHAIQISCAPSILQYINKATTAKDAWKTLAEKCQQPSMFGIDADTDPNSWLPSTENGPELQSVAAVVESRDILALIQSIGRNDLEDTNRLLTANPYLINTEVFRTTVRRKILSVVTVGNLETVNALLRYMSEEDVKAQDSSGRTALHLVACSTGNTKIAESLIGKNKELLTFPDNNGLIPLSLGCAAGYKDMTHYLYNETTIKYLLSPKNKTQAASVVSWCIRNQLFDVALDMLRRCPTLAVAETKDRSNAVLELSLQPSTFLSCSGLLFWQRMICSCLKIKQPAALSSGDDVRINTLEQQDQQETKNCMMQGKEKLFEFWSNLLEFFGIKQLYDLKLTHAYAQEVLLLIFKTGRCLNVEKIYQILVKDAIINAFERGMTKFVELIIETNPDLLSTLVYDNKTLMDIAVEYRQEKVFSLVCAPEALKYDFSTFSDGDGNNLLHVAGLLKAQSQLKLNQISGAALQMQRELQWFKEVESIVPPAYKVHKNRYGETPYQAFDRSHENLMKQGEQWTKDIAQSSTIVGSLILTITFASLFTVPGGNNQETGIPLLLTKKLFKLFIISDAISLFASSTSVLIFLGVLTSRYSKDDFLTSLPTKLIIGLFALFIAIATTMVAFCSTVIILLKGQLELVIPIVMLAAIPICIFVRLQFPLLATIFISTYGPGIFDRK